MAALPVSQPQVQVSAGGGLLPGIVSVEIEQVGYFAAGRFTVVCALGAAQAGASAFLALGAASVTISIGTGAGLAADLFTGRIDNIRVDVRAGTVMLSGRDLAGLLIDSEVFEAFANQTSSEIAETIAACHGLTANVTATSTPVGQYYDLDHARSALALHSRAGTAWNLLSWLALIEGFSLSVAGTTLNFGPGAPGSSLALTPGDCLELSLDFSAAMPAGVAVMSWNTRQKTVFQQMEGAASGTVTTLIRPNLTQQQAAAYAQNHLSGLARQTSMISVVMPGELTLLPGSTIVLSGTGSTFDQNFEIETIRRSIDARRGFTQSIRAYLMA